MIQGPPRPSTERSTSAATTTSSATTASSAAPGWSRARGAAPGGEHRRRARPVLPLLLDQTVSPNAAPAVSLPPELGVRARGLQGRRLEVPRQRRAQVRRRPGRHQRRHRHCNGGAGQRIYMLHRPGTRTARSLPAPLLRQRPRAGLDHQRPVDLADRDVPLVSEPNSVSTAAYGQASWKAGVELHPEFRHALRAPGSQRPVRRELHRPRRQLGAATGVRLGSAGERAVEAVRLLRPLLREHSAGHQHPRLRRRSAGASPTTSARIRTTSSPWTSS